MIFTAYFDESDTHGPAPTVIMGAFLGDSRQWQLFGRRLRNLQKKSDFRLFHAKDFKRKRGEFQGWSDQKCRTLISDLTETVRDNLTEGVAIRLERARYVDEYRSPPVPKKMVLDSQYGLCFRACLAHLATIVFQNGTKNKLHVVIEDGHHNVGDARRIFNELKVLVQRRFGQPMLGTLTIAKKQECEELMIADFLAHTYSMMLDEDAPVDYSAQTPQPRKRHAGLTFLEFQPDALLGLKEDFERRRQEWRALTKAKGAGRAVANLPAASEDDPTLGEKPV